MTWSFSKLLNPLAFIVVTAMFLYITVLMIFGRPHAEGHFTYFCKKGWGMFDGVSCEAGIKGPYWLWVQEGGRIVLMYDRAGAGIGDKASVTQVGFDDRYLVAKLENQAWYIFDHGNKDEPWFRRDLNWVEPKGPYSEAELIDRIGGLPEMRLTRTAL
jgi:hypothetical protein